MIILHIYIWVLVILFGQNIAILVVFLLWPLSHIIINIKHYEDIYMVWSSGFVVSMKGRTGHGTRTLVRDGL